MTQTNGTLVTDKVADFLKHHNIGVGVSIDGPEWLNNLSRPMLGGGESHQRTVRGIETLRCHGIPLGTIVVLNRANVDYPEELADFLVRRLRGERLSAVWLDPRSGHAVRCLRADLSSTPYPPGPDARGVSGTS